MNGCEVGSLIVKKLVEKRGPPERPGLPFGRFVGVFQADQIPQNVEHGSVFVVNTSPLPDGRKVHQHWVVFCVMVDKGVLEFFDSFGKDPHFYGGHIEKYCSSFRVVPSGIQFQGNGTNVCGGYCVLFSVKLCLDELFDDILEEMKKDKINDAWIHRSLEMEGIYIPFFVPEIPCFFRISMGLLVLLLVTSLAFLIFLDFSTWQSYKQEREPFTIAEANIFYHQLSEESMEVD